MDSLMKPELFPTVQEVMDNATVSVIVIAAIFFILKCNTLSSPLGCLINLVYSQYVRKKCEKNIEVMSFGAPIIPGDITLNDLYNIIPMNPPVSTTDLTGKELLEMLEENLERTFSCDPYLQMGGYVKRCLGLTLYFKIENPSGHRIQKLFIGNEEADPDHLYTAAFVTMQGFPQKYGRNRKNHSERIIDVMQNYLARHSPIKAELRGTVIVV